MSEGNLGSHKEKLAEKVTFQHILASENLVISVVFIIVCIILLCLSTVFHHFCYKTCRVYA